MLSINSVFNLKKANCLEFVTCLSILTVRIIKYLFFFGDTILL